MFCNNSHHINCQHCHISYGRGSRRPVSLICHHTICEHCVRDVDTCHICDMPTMPITHLPVDDDPWHARVDTAKGVYHVDRLALDIMQGNVLHSMCSAADNSIYCMPCASVIADYQTAMHGGHRRRLLPNIEM